MDDLDDLDDLDDSALADGARHRAAALAALSEHSAWAPKDQWQPWLHVASRGSTWLGPVIQVARAKKLGRLDTPVCYLKAKAKPEPNQRTFKA